MFDLNYFNKIDSKNSFIAGVDEVGRGPLAGPVVAACVLIYQKEKNQNEMIEFLTTLEDFGVQDSKKINTLKRKKIIEMFSLPLVKDKKIELNISKNLTLKYQIQEISVDEIDQINILNASLKAMEIAFDGVACGSGILLIDGNKKFSKNYENISLETVVKGDSKSLIIGLASIIAKEYRDNLMEDLAKIYPQYLWNKNAGYGTAKHLDSIIEFGVTKHHRKTFKGVKEYYEEGRV